MEVLQILGQREGAKPSFGNLKPSGAIDSPVTGDLAPLVFMAIMGAPVSTADFTTDVWTAATLYDVGDVVNHSDRLKPRSVVNIFTAVFKFKSYISV